MLDRSSLKKKAKHDEKPDIFYNVEMTALSIRVEKKNGGVSSDHACYWFYAGHLCCSLFCC